MRDFCWSTSGDCWVPWKFIILMVFVVFFSFYPVMFGVILLCVSGSGLFVEIIFLISTKRSRLNR